MSINNFFLPSSKRRYSLFYVTVRIIRRVFTYMHYSLHDCIRFAKASVQREENLKCVIINTYHVIEKGLTMPERRLGFGKDKILLLIDYCLTYINLYGKEQEQIQFAISVIAKYKQLHDKENFDLDITVEKSINYILSLFDTIPLHDYSLVKKEDFFKYTQSHFDIFSNSRHSLRNFSGDVDIETVKKAIALAQNAPSACNRQSTRIKIITDTEKIRIILGIQHGNRGFGHLIDKLIMVTSELSNWGAKSRNGCYIDAGIYTMNLLYALHFYKIGACTLNCYLTPEQERKMRKCLSIPYSENIILLIALGNPPESFYVTKSFRYSAEQIISII